MTPQAADPHADPPSPTATAHLDLRGPYDLREVALMGFGHRDEQEFDSVMRLACCVDGDYERQVGVEVRQVDDRLELRVRGTPGSPSFDEETLGVITRQVARVLSVDHDGADFARLCAGDPVLARLHALAPGFRPALFYSPYEAAVWSIISARRARPQGIALRTRLGQRFGATFDLSGVSTVSVPTPSQLLQIESVPGLPADRLPRLHAVAEAAQQGRLSAAGLLALDPVEAMAELQRLPGIGPFYATLILVRATGAVDLLAVEEGRGRQVVAELYGLDHELSNAAYEAFAERWRPFRTWAVVMLRALSSRLEGPSAARG